MKFSVVGLGNEKNQITLEGLEVVKSADVVVVKTALTPTVETLAENGVQFVSCDFLFDEADDFSDLDKKIEKFLTSQQGNIVFCVNGSGSNDSTVLRLMKKHSVTVFSGVSQSENALKKYPCEGYQFFCATALLNAKVISTNTPLVIAELDDKFLASEVKEKLFEFFDEEDEAIVFGNGRPKKILLYELDRLKKYDEKTTVFIGVKNLTQKKSFEVSDLKEILRVLRGKNGCPWDKAQTHESLRPNVLEEAYELVDAIDSGVIEDIVEETGDNLLQSYFHISLAEENGEFNEKEVLTRLCDKLIFRHTHIFGNDKAASSEEALKVWEKNKAVEKGTVTVSDSMKKVAKSLPSLTRASKVQKRCLKSGLNFELIEDDCSFEDITEALKTASQEDKEKLLGKLLFKAASVSRECGIDPEVALNGEVERFVSRFEKAEKENEV